MKTSSVVCCLFFCEISETDWNFVSQILTSASLVTEYVTSTQIALTWLVVIFVNVGEDSLAMDGDVFVSVVSSSLQHNKEGVLIIKGDLNSKIYFLLFEPLSIEEELYKVFLNG